MITNLFQYCMGQCTVNCMHREKRVDKKENVGFIFNHLPYWRK